jgi:hypothetical protein
VVFCSLYNLHNSFRLPSPPGVKLQSRNIFSEVKMSKGLKITLIVVGVLAGTALLVCGGIVLGRTVLNRWGDGRPFAMMNRGGFIPNDKQENRFGPGMMGRRGVNPQPAQRGGFGSGMMGRFNNNYTGTPLTVDETKQAVESYLTSLNNTDLALKEVMVFNNNAYGLIVEKSTGKGALEVLVDPRTKAVSPEFGPNMMWNLKYSLMGAGGCGRGMMGAIGTCGALQPSTANVAEMTVTAAQAIQNAQEYLDKNIAGTKAASDPMAFYGYYTLDYTKDGKPVGMLSVNGYTGQVWLHTWHGTFIEEWQAQ